VNKNHEANKRVMSWHPHLRPELPCVYGPVVDYWGFRAQLVEIDRLLD